jgi:hypothetical protein
MSKTPEIRIKVPSVDRLLLLTEAQLKVWLWYKRREGKDKRAYGKAKTIADACGLEAGTIRNARSWLVRNGWLLRREEPGKGLPLFLSVIPESHQEAVEVSSSNDSAVISELHRVSFEDEAQVVSLEVVSMKDSALASGSKEVREEASSLAPLASSDMCEKQRDKTFSALTDSANQEQNQNQELSHMIPLIETVWRERTQRPFTAEDKVMANALILAHGYRLVEAVLRSTLNERPKSAKMRWTNFAVFVRNWDTNHDLYLSDVAAHNANRKNGYKKTVVKKFSESPIGESQAKNLKAHFQTYGKLGEWTLTKGERDAMGFTEEQMKIVVRFVCENGFAVTKDRFLALMHEATGLQLAMVTAAGTGFDREEA